MITKLTKEQEDQISVYVDMFVKIGLNTDRIDESKLKTDIQKFYKFFIGKFKPEIVVRDSPASAWDFICQKIGKKLKFVAPFINGSFDSNIFSFYEYFNHVVNVKFDSVKEKYDAWKSMISYGLVYPFDDYCIVSQKPVKINRKGTIVHCDGGPAISYADGFNVYILNGVRVSKEIAETPWDKLNPRLILTEANAEVRREIVQKIGIEKICKELNTTVLDSKGDYELLGLDIGDKNQRPYLKMKNPSIQVYHIEGVHPSCKTVDDALLFRNKTKEPPVILT